LVGVLVALVYTLWAVSRSAFDTVALGLPNVAAIFFPIVALVAAFVLCVRPLGTIMARSRYAVVSLAAASIIVAFLAGMFYAGGSSQAPVGEVKANVPHEFLTGDSLPSAKLIWDSRCASCHGTDGKFNEKFVREFYPVPQKLTAARLDSLGTDSLVRVILNGRANMNPYDGRLTEAEARALVNYMRSLAPADTMEVAP